MPERSPDAHFKELKSRLLAAGVRPDGARRLVDELRDHYEDVVDELVAEGEPESDASLRALRQLGSAEVITRQASQYDALKSWWRRFPRTALVAYPLACAAVLPAVPVIAGVRHRAVIARWLSCVAGGALVTTTMLLLLTFAIRL